MSRKRSSLLAAAAALTCLVAVLAPAGPAAAATAPLQVGPPTATQFTDRIRLDWTEPGDGGSPILSYNVYSQTGLVTALVATVPAGTTTAVVLGSALTGANAVLTVKAVNAVGEGPGAGRTAGLVASDWPFIRDRGDGTGELALGQAPFTNKPQGFTRPAPLDTVGDHVGLAMTRDQSRLVFGVRATPATDLDLYTLPADSSAGRTLLVGETGVQEADPTWSPDGSAVVYTRTAAGATALYRVPVSGGAPSGPAVPVTNGAGLAEADWSPVGGFLVARPASGTGTLVTLDPATGARTPIAGTSGAVTLAVSPRGEAVGYLVNGPGPSVCLRLAMIGRAVPVKELGCYAVTATPQRSVVWDPDGTWLWAPAIGPIAAQRPNVDGATGQLFDVENTTPGSMPVQFTRRYRTRHPVPGMLGLPAVEAEHVSVPFAPPLQADGTPYPTTCSLDGAPGQPCSTPFAGLLPVGGHSLVVTATSGGASSWSWASRRETRPTDRTGDGRPDLLAQDATGKVWIYPSTATGFAARRRFAESDTTVKVLDGYVQEYPDPVPGAVARTSNSRIDSLDTAVGAWSLTLVSQSWASNVVTASVGDLDQDGTYDLVAKDTAGVLWLYPGTTRDQVTGLIEYPTRRQIGTGWGGFTRIVGPGDFNGDRRADLIAVDVSGAAWLYPGNGAGGFLARVKVAGGWQSFTALTAPGDWDRDGHADLLVRTSNGQLWVYPGTGTGGFKPRRLLPGSWGPFIALVS